MAVSGAGHSMAVESLLVNCQEISKHGRGYDLAIIDPTTGVIDSVATYDTWVNRRGGEGLTNHLHELPDGKIVTAVVRDDRVSWMHSVARTRYGP